MVIKLDSDSNPNPLIRYADFLVICHIQNPRDFCGFVVKPDGVYVNMHLDDPTLFPHERAVLSWHPTGRYKEPALALPCTVSEFKNFISEAGLLGCVVEEELSRREWMQHLRDERQSDPANLRNLAEKFERFGMKVGFKDLADKPLPQTGVFSDAQVQSLVASRNSALTGIAANCSQVGARADFRKPRKIPQYVPDGIDPSEATKTIAVKYVPMDSAPSHRVQGSSKERSDLLTPIIKKIQSELNDPFDKHEIWLRLSALAESKLKPMIGVAPEGIQWKNTNDEPKFLSFKALGERLSRERKRQNN